MWPDSHVSGDDVWVITVDGTMFASNEIAGEVAVKTPRTSLSRTTVLGSMLRSGHWLKRADVSGSMDQDLLEKMLILSHLKSQGD